METVGLSKTRSCPQLSRALSGAGEWGTSSRMWEAWLEAAPGQPRNWISEPAVQGEGPRLGSDSDIPQQIDGARPKSLTHIPTSKKTPKTGPSLKVWVKSFGSKPGPNLTQKLFILSIFIPLSVNIYTIVLQKYKFDSSQRNAPESAGGVLSCTEYILYSLSRIKESLNS